MSAVWTLPFLESEKTWNRLSTTFPTKLPAFLLLKDRSGALLLCGIQPPYFNGIISCTLRTAWVSFFVVPYFSFSEWEKFWVFVLFLFYFLCFCLHICFDRCSVLQEANNLILFAKYRLCLAFRCPKRIKFLSAGSMENRRFRNFVFLCWRM